MTEQQALTNLLIAATNTLARRKQQVANLEEAIGEVAWALDYMAKNPEYREQVVGWRIADLESAHRLAKRGIDG